VLNLSFEVRSVYQNLSLVTYQSQAVTFATMTFHSNFIA
jgi:hypothetical protein